MRLKAEKGHYQMNLMEFSANVVRAVHGLYYNLAKEMAEKCDKSDEKTEIIKYSLGAVILSYSAIDTYFLNKLETNKSLKKQIQDLSINMRKEFDRMELINKIEFLFLLKNNQSSSINKGTEPLQSLEVLKQFRNISIHYESYPENSELTKKEWDNFEKKAVSKFNFDDEDTFVWRVYTKSAASWSVKLIDSFKIWFEKELEL